MDPIERDRPSRLARPYHHRLLRTACLENGSGLVLDRYRRRIARAGMRREVTLGTERRRCWSGGQKLKMLSEAGVGGTTVEVARRHDVTRQHTDNGAESSGRRSYGGVLARPAVCRLSGTGRAGRPVARRGGFSPTPDLDRAAVRAGLRCHGGIGDEVFVRLIRPLETV